MGSFLLASSYIINAASQLGFRLILASLEENHVQDEGV